MNRNENEVDYLSAINDYMNLMDKWRDKHLIGKGADIRLLGKIVIAQCLTPLSPFLGFINYHKSSDSNRDINYFKDELLEEIEKQFSKNKDNVKNDDT